MKSGLHWRNVRPLDADAWEIAEYFDGFVVMSNMGPELPLAIHERWPEKQIIARLYWPAGELPTYDVAFLVWYDYINATRDVITHYQILNEPDVEYPIGPMKFSDWFNEMTRRLDGRFPGLQWGFPMPSISGEAGWAYALLCDHGIQEADWLAERGYWEQDWQMDDWNWGSRYYRCHQQWPDKPIHITEYGCSAKDMDGPLKAVYYFHYLSEMPKYVGSAAVFLMDGTSDWQGFSVTEGMAYIMAGQGIGHEFPQPPTDGAIWPVYEGENMDQATINRLWGDYLSFPAFARFRAEHPELGDALEDRERDYGIYRVKFFAGGIIGARVGDWENIVIWTSKDQLPPLS